MNEATHGIEIQSHSLDNDITREYFRKSILAGKEVGENAKIDVSVWDFAGQPLLHLDQDGISCVVEDERRRREGDEGT